jgi:hypothetical protein
MRVCLARPVACTKSVRGTPVSARALYAGRRIMRVMDAVSVLIAVAFIALLLLLIKGIDRI